MALADALPVQGFAPNRVAYLDKHVRAMETLARKLCGETFTLAEEAKRSLDIHPTWTPEVQFEQAHALYESTVSGGAGSLAERVRASQGIRCPAGTSDLGDHGRRRVEGGAVSPVDRDREP